MGGCRGCRPISDPQPPFFSPGAGVIENPNSALPPARSAERLLFQNIVTQCFCSVYTSGACSGPPPRACCWHSHGTGDARGDPRWLPRSSRRYEQGTSFPAAGAPPLLLGGVSTGALLAEDNGEKTKHIYPCSPKHHLLSAPFDPRLDEHAQNVVMPNPPLVEAAAVSPAAPSTPAGGSRQ